MVDDVAVTMILLLQRDSSIHCDYLQLFCYHLLFVITIEYSGKFHEYANHYDHYELLLRMLVLWECALKGKTRLPFDDVLAELSAWLSDGDSNLEIRGTI